MMNKAMWHLMSGDHGLKQLERSLFDISAKRSKARLLKYGKNEIPTTAQTSSLKKHNPIIAITGDGINDGGEGLDGKSE